MKKKNIIKLGMMMGAAFLLPVMAEAAVLEAIDDSDEREFKTIDHVVNEALPEFHIGSSISGTSGLVTIPTPDYNEITNFGISYKGSSRDFDMKVNGEKVSNTTKEGIVSARYNPSPEFEISVTNMHYKRTNDKNIDALEHKDNVTAGGLKYTNAEGGNNFCVGFNFAPMSAEDMNNLDIEQLEAMRNVYFTFSEQVDQRLSGYFNIGMAFTKDQKIETGIGDPIEIDRKNIVYGGIGVEYEVAKNFQLFGEFKVANYRDFEAYQEKPEKHRAHVGARFGSENFQLEVVGKNITGDNPYVQFGGAVGF